MNKRHRFTAQILEKISERILFISSTVTSLAVLLIIIFMFREGLGLFNHTPVEEGSILAINRANPVKELTAEQVKKIFDQEITNWKEVGGIDSTIELFRIDDIFNFYTEEQVGSEFENLGQLLSEHINAHSNILAFFPAHFKIKNFLGKELPVEKISFGKFFLGKEWFPTAHPAAQFGILSLILGTLWISIGAILIALPFGLATAIYMSEIADERVRNFLKPVIELLAGIPSVVYGFFGLVVIVPAIQQIFNLPVGETALAGSIILGVMALPTIITISEDALRTTPRTLKEASLALGANQWQTIYKVTVPYASSGITAAAILGIARAMGETMAVLMVTGNAAVIPTSFLQPVRTIPATIAAELGEAPQDGMHYKALFALGCILFFITLIINFAVQYISSRKKHD